jgi:hypothetical protein
MPGFRHGVEQVLPEVRQSVPGVRCQEPNYLVLRLQAGNASQTAMSSVRDMVSASEGQPG